MGKKRMKAWNPTKTSCKKIAMGSENGSSYGVLVSRMRLVRGRMGQEANAVLFNITGVGE
jgi:hypothetical protein